MLIVIKGCGGQVRWMKWTFILRIIKIIGFWLHRMSLNQLWVWNVSIWVRWPCRTDLCQLVIITFQYDIRMRFDLVRALMFSGGKIFLSLLIKPAALRNQISIHCNSWNWPELKFCWSTDFWIDRPWLK